MSTGGQAPVKGLLVSLCDAGMPGGSGNSHFFLPDWGLVCPDLPGAAGSGWGAVQPNWAGTSEQLCLAWLSGEQTAALSN